MKSKKIKEHTEDLIGLLRRIKDDVILEDKEKLGVLQALTMHMMEFTHSLMDGMTPEEAGDWLTEKLH